MSEPNPASRLVPVDDVALAIVDIQDRLAAVMHRRDDVVGVAVTLVRVAAILDIPVIVTRQYAKGLGDTVPEVLEALDDARAHGASIAVVDKMDFDCLAEPGFRQALEAAGRAHVALVGMEAHICVVQTALSLAASGRAAHIVSDAVCSRRDEDRDVALARMTAAGIDVLPSESVIYEALGRAGTPEFKAVLQVVKGG